MSRVFEHLYGSKAATRRNMHATFFLAVLCLAGGIALQLTGTGAGIPLIVVALLGLGTAVFIRTRLQR